MIPIDHLMVGVVMHRNNLGAREPQMNQERAVVLRKKSRLFDLFEIERVAFSPHSIATPSPQ